MTELLRQPLARIGPRVRLLGNRRRLFLHLAYSSLLLPVSCGQPARVAPARAELPEFVWSPPLAYPQSLREAGVTGTVVLQAVVDTAGLVEPNSITVVSSSRAAFERPAIEMLLNSRFRPARSGAGPARMQVRVPVRFTLGRRGVSQADSLAAVERVAAGERLASEGQIDDAMKEYAAAQALDSRLSGTAQFWYGLCWYGSVWGYADDVMTACHQAVALEADRGSMHDGRAIARILTGDFAGAIADLEVFVDWTTNERDRLQRANWIRELRAGRNPLTPEVLRSLRRTGGGG